MSAYNCTGSRRKLIDVRSVSGTSSMTTGIWVRRVQSAPPNLTWLTYVPAKVSCVVIDGITVGHPCCAVHNCKTPLDSQRHRFCASHADLNSQCAIVGCEQPVTANSQVCADPLHKAVEERHTERGQSRFQLHQKLERARLAGAANPVPTAEAAADNVIGPEAEETEYVVDAAGHVAPEEAQACSDKPDSGNRRLRAQFGRKRTHNEEIIVAPCGVIIARATFFGAEAVHSVVV